MGNLAYWRFWTVALAVGMLAAANPLHSARAALPQASSNLTQAGSPGDTRKAESTTQNYADEAWRVLWLGLHNPRAAHRLEAVKSLSLMKGNRRAFVFALRALNDKDFHVRAAAATTLGNLHDKNAVPALKSALSDKEPSVMLAAAHSLYLFKDPTAYEIYYAILMGDKKASSGLIQEQIDKLKDPKQMAEMGFEEGLGFVPYGGTAYEAYRTVIKRGNDSARATAARFLALDPDPISEDALLQTALADKKVLVRQAAVDALTQRDDPHCVERLERNLHENLYAVRYRTAAAILHLDRRRRENREN
ncbi:MAG TPA: HEAT repeat domain-containing protein [Terriglobales bacterium]|nr:HEAT repeat domain-containing protein [Terriglobales bacterium]